MWGTNASMTMTKGALQPNRSLTAGFNDRSELISLIKLSQIWFQFWKSNDLISRNTVLLKTTQLQFLKLFELRVTALIHL